MGLLIEAGVDVVNVFLIKLFLGKAKAFAEALEVDNFTRPKEFDNIVDIGIIAEPEDVVIGYPCLLFWHAQSFATK